MKHAGARAELGAAVRARERRNATVVASRASQRFLRRAGRLTPRQRSAWTVQDGDRTVLCGAVRAPRSVRSTVRDATLRMRCPVPLDVRVMVRVDRFRAACREQTADEVLEATKALLLFLSVRRVVYEKDPVTPAPRMRKLKSERRARRAPPRSRLSAPAVWKSTYTNKLKARSREFPPLYSFYS